MSCGRVLLIVRDSDLRRSISFSLETHGYEVVALQRWAGEPAPSEFACIVFDDGAMMKAEDSTWLLEASTSPLILMTYGDGHEMHLELSAVVPMPLKGEAVPEAVASVMSARKAST